MYLIPLIRANRAISACILYPEHPIQAIAISEIASVVLPLFTPKLFPKIIALMLAIIYAPNFASSYIKNFNEVNHLHYQAEICSILLFIAYYYLQNYDNFAL